MSASFGEVEIDLHRAGARHHVQAKLADLGHVVAHDLVAAFRHPRHFVAPPLGLEAHAEEAEPQFVGDAADLFQMAGDFAAGVMDGVELAAGQFELAGRFQRDRGVAARQRDDIAVLFDRLPTEAREAAQQCTDAALAFVSRRTQIVKAKTEFLVLGADLPLRFRARTRGDVFHELVAVRDRGFLDCTRSGHGFSLC